MARKPETTFIASIHAKLPRVYFEKNHNEYLGGTADVFYSGIFGPLWIEYKFIPRIPVRVPVKANLSELQRKWLEDRHAEGRRVAVIIGCKEGGVWLEKEDWGRELPPDEFRERLVTRATLANRIHSITGDSPCRFPTQPSTRPKESTQSTES